MPDKRACTTTACAASEARTSRVSKARAGRNVVREESAMTLFGILFFSALNLAMMIVNCWIARRMETAARDLQSSAQTNMLIMSMIDEWRGRPPMMFHGEPERRSRLQ